MPKMKTKSSAKKRFKVTANGHVKAGQAGKRHGMIKRTKKFIRNGLGTITMFHVDAKNVIATRWEPLLDEQGIAGYRTRLLETTGRRAKTRLRAFRDVSSAQVVDYRGEPRRDCSVEGDAVLIELGPFEWAQIEARW